MTASSPGLRLSAAGAATRLPYDRSCITPGIVHLGVGAFHRAHAAVYVDDVVRADPSWGIIGASAAGRPDHLVEGFLSLSEVFGHDLPGNKAFRKALTGHLASLMQRGARQTVSLRNP